jgi:hypothetical protein
MREHVARSNIHAGIATLASSAITQMKTSSVARLSRYSTATSLPRAGCHG